MTDTKSQKATLPPGRMLVLAAVGSICGFLGESFHAWTGVWAVSPGAGHPWWVAGVYFLALVAAGFFFPKLERRTRYALEVSSTALAVEVVLFLGLFLSPSLLHAYELPLAFGFAVYAAVRLVFFRTPGDVTAVGFAMVVDLAFEGTAVAVGVYHYPNAAWMGVPVWLAPFWAGLGLSIRRFYRAAMVEGNG